MKDCGVDGGRKTTDLEVEDAIDGANEAVEDGGSEAYEDGG